MKIFDKIRYGLRIPQILSKVTENNKILKELEWAEIFNSTISGSCWFSNQGISPGRWAVGYPLLYILYRILNEVKPVNVLEFGLGQSTIMLHKYAAWQKASYITTIEHSQEWINNYLKREKIPDNCTIRKHEHLTVEVKGYKTLSFNSMYDTIKDQIFDLILIDAPFGSENYSRPQILELLNNNINYSHFCIIMDDHNRQGEKDTCSEIEHYLNCKDIIYSKNVYSGQKDVYLICSSNLLYLSSL